MSHNKNRTVAITDLNHAIGILNNKSAHIFTAGSDQLSVHI